MSREEASVVSAATDTVNANAPVDSSPSVEKAQPAVAIPAQDEFPGTAKVISIMTCVYGIMFLGGLDRTIVSTATPAITNEFHSLGDVGWYGSAYLIAATAFVPFIGKIYRQYDPKWVFIATFLLFEIGSVVCGAANSSVTFIVGRAIAGLGNGGSFTGMMTIMVYIIPLHKRPMYQAIGGLSIGVTSVLGPLIGGAFTTDVSWRWCFYINLCVGMPFVGYLVFFLKLPNMPKKDRQSFREQCRKLDPAGTTVFIGSITSLLLAVQWGGSTYAWSNGRIIALFVVFGVTMPIFVWIQHLAGEDASMPLRIITQRSVALATIYATLVGGSLTSLIYYVPLWFQAVENVSAIESGVRTIPMMLAMMLGALLAGAFVRRQGYYVPPMILAGVLSPIGAGLVSTFWLDTSEGKWIGYQIIYGFGIGVGLQQTGLAIQAVLDRKDVPIGGAFNFFGMGLGGGIFVSVTDNIFINQFAANLKGIPNLPPDFAKDAGATALRKLVPADELHQVLVAYNGALKDCFYVGVALAALLGPVALGMEWKDIRKKPQGQTKSAAVPADSGDKKDETVKGGEV
ncbi:MAG: hypothetical protein OHK93_007374 [Ramalina farinacea]|uniref:Major facilitator superfamily (MFS) profile domain-containing protein n=1 Tax=Ramalina farinacea TaxID=258253 RepID=A0AA43TVG5_9LECA|nr:hypothetical protein [Ramalina farinacea]